MVKKKEDSNFKKAVSELLGTENKKNEKPVQPVKPDQPVKPAQPADEVHGKTLKVKKEEAGSDTSFMKKMQEMPMNREESIIPADMVLKGNVTTQSDMKVVGSIIGDVECDGNIYLQGSIMGNISAGNLTVQKGKLTGDVSVKENVSLEKESELNGNISAHNVYANAKIEGQIKADGLVELKEHAVVHGDIAAETISIHTGARIKGMVNVGE